MPLAAHFIQWFSTGWFTSTPSKRTKPTSGQSTVSTVTRTNSTMQNTLPS